MKVILFVLSLALLTQSQHIDEDKLMSMKGKLNSQDLQTVDVKNISTSNVDGEKEPVKILQEFEDHAELKVEVPINTSNHSTKGKSKSPSVVPSPKPVVAVPPVDGKIDESEDVEPTAANSTEVENVPTPVPLKLEPVTLPEVLETNDDSVPSSTEKSATESKDLLKAVTRTSVFKSVGETSVFKFGGETSVFAEESTVPSSTKKSTSVGKKGVKFEKPSVSARKGVELKLKHPSVLPRKEADPSLLNDSSSIIVDSANTQSYLPVEESPVTSTPQSSVSPTPQSSISPIPQSSISPTPQSIVPSIMGMDSAKPPIEIPSTTQQTPTIRFKPTAATDPVGGVAASSKDDDDDDSMTYTPAVVGIVLLLVIIVTIIVVGYRRLQYQWMRRHYARMDFLIDGMYDA